MPLSEIEPHSPSAKKASGHRRSRRHSSIGSSSRKPSLTRNRSTLRLMRTISIESLNNDTFSASGGEDEDNSNSDYNDVSGTNQDSEDKIGNLSIKSGISQSSSDIKTTPAKKGSGGVSASSTDNSIEVPFVKVALDITLPQDYFKKDVANMIQSLKVPRWYARGLVESPSKMESLRLTKIAGAMTNAIFKVEYPASPSLLLRVYGSNNDMIIDREYELQVLARLSVQHIGPSLYGCFLNGRFEQFLENATTLTKDDIRDWKTSQRIARRMKELHTGVPLLRFEKEQGSMAWNKIDQWLKEIEMNGGDWISNDDNVQQVFGAPNWKEFKESIRKYREWLFENSKSPYVFCHNDAQYGNLLFSAPVINSEKNDLKKSLDESNLSTSSLFPSDSRVSLKEIINPTKQEQSQDSKLVVIDFEYAGANVAAYDLSNHFSEWMYDYNSSTPHKCFSDQYPTTEQMLNFVYSYVSHLRGGVKTDIDDDARLLYNDIKKWRGTVQSFWSLWALIQSGKIQFQEQESTKVDEGLVGEKYIIKTEDTAIDELVDDIDTNDVIEAPEGVSIDTFDYSGYCTDKISVFWGDIIGFNIITKSECIENKVKYLSTDLL